MLIKQLQDAGLPGLQDLHSVLLILLSFFDFHQSCGVLLDPQQLYYLTNGDTVVDTIIDIVTISNTLTACEIVTSTITIIIINIVNGIYIVIITVIDIVVFNVVIVVFFYYYCVMTLSSMLLLP